MQGNWPIFILALSVFLLGLIGTMSTSHRPYSLAQNFSVIVMVSGVLMTGGLIAFAILSAAIYLVRGL